MFGINVRVVDSPVVNSVDVKSKREVKKTSYAAAQKISADVLVTHIVTLYQL